jgi:hypothetical protein
MLIIGFCQTQNISIRDTSKFGVFLNGCETTLNGIASQSANGRKLMKEVDTPLQDGNPQIIFALVQRVTILF